jgi:hypothetical protein
MFEKYLYFIHNLFTLWILFPIIEQNLLDFSTVFEKFGSDLFTPHLSSWAVWDIPNSAYFNIIGFLETDGKFGL